MRVRLSFAGLVLVCAMCEPSFAYDSFIPMGHSYASENIDYFALTVEDRAAIGAVDAYETEIYLEQLRQKHFSMQLQNFSSDRNATGFDY